MLLPLSEAKEDIGIKTVLGVCSDSPEGLELINAATRQLMSRGDWAGTIVPIQLCVFSGCVVWPRYVGQVRKMNVCNWPVEISNMWYSFMPMDNSYGYSWAWGASDWGQRWWGTSSWGRWIGGACRSIDYGKSPVFQDIVGEGRLVRAYVRCQADIGKTVTIFGVDNTGQPLMTRDSEDNWTEGITLTLQTPFASTSVFVRHIDRVLKQQTQCIVDMYAYDAANDVLEPLAHYEPSETNPAYAKSQLQSGWPQGDCGCLKKVAALVKLKFIKAQVDTDLVLIDNLDALATMIQSIKYKREGNIGISNQFELDAIRQLNSQLRDEMPLDQMPIQVRTFGDAPIGYQRMF